MLKWAKIMTRFVAGWRVDWQCCDLRGDVADGEGFWESEEPAGYR